MAHLSGIEIEAIVTGSAPAGEQARRHLRECTACARELAREARLEDALHESLLAPAAASAPGVRPAARRWLLPAAAALTIVAAGAWLVGTQLRGDGAAVATPAAAVVPS